MNLRLKIVLYIPMILLIGTFLPGCAPTVRNYGNEERNGSEDNTDLRNEFGNSDVLFTSEGTASYYSDQFHGKLTANGETYNMYGISAAHPEFPLETIVRITNLKNNRSVILRINDRMPDFKGRMIDLSLGAAKELDMLGDGIAKVRLEVLKWGKGKKKK